MTQRVGTFDVWRPGYGGAEVHVYLPNTTTLVSLFKDEALTIPADNPQYLMAMTDGDGTIFGKFKVPVYTGSSFYLSINGNHDTGIVRPPFSSLNGEDASGATVTPTGSTKATTLADIASYSVNVAMYGDFVEGISGIAATNTATLALAIAALSNGGEVIVPEGLYKVNSVQVPQGVVICGAGRESTTLQSVVGDVSFTLVGNRSGFKDISLDGNTLMTGSVGIRSVGQNETVFESVMVRRFETGIHFLGGGGHIWNDFSIENVETAAKLFGDSDTGLSSNGPFRDLVWTGGLVSVATTAGIVMSFEDRVCHNISFNSVGFELCTQYAIQVNGAQSVYLNDCWWQSNDKDIDIHDDAGTIDADNIAVGIIITGGRMNGGEVKVSGTAQNVRFKDVKIEGVTFNMATPIYNFVLLEDCYEDDAVVITGEPSKLLRNDTQSDGMSFGLTSTNVATKAWSIALDPGQIVYLVGKVIGKGRNAAQRAVYHIATGAFRAGSQLNYDSQTANFTAGALLTGATSGAKARIQADSDSGTTGTLTLTDIEGTFLDNEIITDSNGSPGSATVNGLIVAQNAALDTVGVVSLRTAYETDAAWAAVFVANGAEIELRVTGNTGQVVEWNVYVDVETT